MLELLIINLMCGKNSILSSKVEPHTAVTNNGIVLHDRKVGLVLSDRENQP